MSLLLRGKMVFVNIKNPLHQDAPDSCTPTCIKVILKTQFNIEKRISSIKKWVGYQLGCGSCSPYNTPARLDEPLTQFKIVPLDLKNANNRTIIELLSKKALPFIFLKTDYLNETECKNIKIYDGGDEWWHCVVIFGFQESNEKVFIYDPLLTYTESILNKDNCKLKIPYALLTKYWKATNNRLFWLASQKGSSLKEKNALLQSFFKTGDN